MFSQSSDPSKQRVNNELNSKTRTTNPADEWSPSSHKHRGTRSFLLIRIKLSLKLGVKLILKLTCKLKFDLFNLSNLSQSYGRIDFEAANDLSNSFSNVATNDRT